MGCLKGIINTKTKIPVIIKSRLPDVFVAVVVLRWDTQSKEITNTHSVEDLYAMLELFLKQYKY